MPVEIYFHFTARLTGDPVWTGSSSLRFSWRVRSPTWVVFGPRRPRAQYASTDAVLGAGPP